MNGSSHPRRGASLRVVVSILASTACVGCGVDTDTVVCEPGFERMGGPRDGTCVPPERESSCVSSVDPPPSSAEPRPNGAPCENFTQCETSSICSTTGGLSRCAPRCDPQRKGDCPAGTECSPAGTCSPLGEVPLDEPCQDELCATGLVCDPDSLRCRLACDPRQPECPEGQACSYTPDGAGFCVLLCP